MYRAALVQAEADPIASNIYISDASNGNLLYDEIGLNPDSTTYLNNITYSYWSYPRFEYDYQVSLLNGDLSVVIAPGLQAGVDVGAGGTATVVGGANSSVVYLWHQKSLIWQATGTGNSISFGDGFSGLAPQQAPINALILNLLTGQGTNPFGGTLQVSHVDGVSGTKALGTYVVANNDGDDIDAGAAGGDALIIGGTGKDTLYGSGSPGSTSVLVAGGGASNLVARSGAAIFVYNGGDDAVYGFNTTAGVADTLDLSSVAGVSNFAAVMADATPSGANTVLTFGAHQTVTLESVAPAQLAASEFIFAPIAGFASTTLSVAGAGTVVPIMLAITDAVSVDLSGGTPSLSLSDGATATYDVAASNPVGHLLVFDYTVGATDQAANLAVTGVNTNGATVTGANGKAVDFAASPNLPLGLQIGTPLTVSSETVSGSGEADAGPTVTITLQMSQGVSVVLGSVAYGATGTPFGLLLNDGAIATYSANLSNQVAGTIVFTDTVAKTDHATNLAITGVIGLTPQINLATLTTVESAGGYTANFAAAIGAPTGLAIGPPVYVGGVSANAAASPTGVGEEANAGQTFQITLTLNEAVTVNTAGGSPTLTLSDGSIATYDAAASTPATGALVFDDTVGVSDHAANATISAVNLNGATVLAVGGQAANFGSAIGVAIGAGLQINPSPLTVTGVSATSSSSYGVASVTVTLTLSEAAIETVPSSTDPQQIIEPGLVLNNGDIARFQSASGNQLTFSPIGAASDNVNLSVASVVLALGAGHGGAIATFTDANGYNADFTKALNVQAGVTVGDPLYVASVTPSVTMAESQGGQPLQITLGLSEAATLSGGAPTLVLNDGGTATYDAAASNLSTGALVFDYTPKAGEEFVSPVINTIDLNGATIADAGGNTADLTSFFGVPLQFQIGPSHILTAAISQIGSLTPGTSTELLLVMSQNVSIDTTGGAPSLTLSNGAIATYDAALTATTAADSASSVGQVVFDYTVGANEGTPNLEITRVNPNGATFTDVVSGLAADLALPSTQYLGASVACYAAGTRIATPSGEAPVEHLRAGDLALLAGGGVAEVVWLGHRTVVCDRHPRPQDVNPVTVSADAFGPGLPLRDLVLSPNHAVYVDGVLIPIRYLINGATIRQTAVAQIEYWHVELPQHDVLLAEGLPAESYLDTGNRCAFANGGDAVQMHPDFAMRVWEAESCADLVLSGPVLAAARRRLRGLATALGFARTDEPDLRFVVDGVDAPLSAWGGAYTVALPVHARHVLLLSRSGVPAETGVASSDHRRLGVAVSRITLNGKPISLRGRALTRGWHTPEGGKGGWRWTDGAAELRVPSGGRLNVTVAMTESYWIDPAGCDLLGGLATPPLVGRRTSHGG
jgi:hypothetical protein